MLFRTPSFWQSDGPVAKMLQPAAILYQEVTEWRMRHTVPYHAPVPVICIGNAVVGGAGKTPALLAVAELLKESGIACHAVSRGYGGKAKAPLKVNLALHAAEDTGDEPQLLARAIPTWVGPSRAATLAAACEEGARCILMDDGLQNPTVAKTLSLLVIDAANPQGNGRIFPAGPLREPLKHAVDRSAAVILIHPEGEAFTLPEWLRPVLKDVPCFHATLQPDEQIAATLNQQRVIAFAGIGRPEKFRHSLQRLGAEIVEFIAFPDHYRYQAKEIALLREKAKQHQAVLVATEKDRVKIPTEFINDITFLPVRLQIEQAIDLRDLILSRVSPVIAS